jgi:hypothetical protein
VCKNLISRPTDPPKLITGRIGFFHHCESQPCVSCNESRTSDSPYDTRTKTGDTEEHPTNGPLGIELTRRHIPFVKLGGLKFLGAAHIKNMLALLRFVENPRDRVVGFRLQGGA